MTRVILKDVVSVLSGLVGGLLGVGGSFIYVPSTVKLFKRPAKLVHAEASILVLSSSIFSTIIYLFNSHKTTFNWQIVSILAICSIFGSLIGVLSWSIMNATVMRSMFGILLLTMAGISTCIPWLPKMNLSSIFLVWVGLFVGFMGGALGVGGGTLTVPILMLGYGITQISAQEMSLAVMMPMSLFSAFIHLRLRHLEIHTLPKIFIFAGIGGIIGSYLATALPSPDLRYSLIVSLLFIGGGNIKKTFTTFHSAETHDVT